MIGTDNEQMFTLHKNRTNEINNERFDRCLFR